MTTRVKIFPSPGDGLKAEVNIQKDYLGQNPEGETKFLRRGDPEMVIHVHGNMSVSVREVPDVKPEEKSDV